ncbi:flavin-containing monooxygenase FMO GS-OX-like 3 isoform X3 [Diaphorina citri]|uniref:Flavin-containing monooxygenase FMO GS-OX-like 3 isoform X3 n=1 Tax=Diaphorina citri TaxID=121845 RepID=A0A3Q0J3F1_DIACI|nr:flavin-containing monooxygenase FMO GS-OX-like 3 isoform X3 [Diaphorina citri]XP_026683007.1 flavin-containing monooxygenase FMO GS-OX-like 3 isoform X3 [Diaphorina citri]
MAVIGVPTQTIIFRLFDLEVQYYIKVLLGEISLPDRGAMMDELEAELKDKQTRGLKRKHYHVLGENMEKYINDLTALCGGTVRIPRAVIDIYHHSGRERKKFNFKRYRNFVYTILDDDHFEVYEREESQL